MKLNKRNYKTRIRLTPYGCDYLRVHWRIGGKNHYFYPSCVMGSQFSAFLSAVYSLYEEEKICHVHWPRKHKNFTHEYPFQGQDGKHLISSTVHWDEEGFTHSITFTRQCDDNLVCENGQEDPINIHIKSGNVNYNYTLDGKALCYAVAKGCTEAIKQYGLTGYRQSSGMQYPGDSFDIHELLFVKAYALDALHSRDTQELWSKPKSWQQAEASSFDKELELLLFDM